jgi:altronate hydrolase
MDLPDHPTPAPATFEGYLRADGRVGTRNYLGVFVVGNCAATAARNVADWFTAKRLAAFPHVDGVLPFVHELGCGMEKSGEPMDLLRRTLGGSIRNPNLAGALVMALGCERNNIYAFLEQEGLGAGQLLKTVVLQEVGGTARAVEEGIAAIQAMLPLADQTHREPVPAAQLAVGLQAGQGAHARIPEPVQQALGVAVDLLVAQGGTVIVSDTRASAQALLARSAAPQVGAQLQERVVWWQGYTAGRDTAPAQAPATALPHSGSAALQAVFGYAQVLPARGLVLMDAPGYEAVSATGQVASGATLVCVVTPTGSAFGAAGVPTVKLASDSAVFRQLEDDLDLDAGPAADGRETPQALGRRIFDAWLAHASGRPTRSEALGVGENEFVPWPIGVLA